MKKLLFIVLIIAAIASAIYLFGSKDKAPTDLSEIFDDKPDNIVAETITVPDNIQNTATSPSTEDEAANTETVDQENQETSNENADTEASSDNTDSETDNTSEENNESSEKSEEAQFSHSESEKQIIAGRYIEAEDFYYTMLYQQFDLDSYDVIVRKNDDGYNTEYHRVLYFDVNSKSELRDCYREYFTDDFVSKLDLGSYIEENGKLYCAENVNASLAKGTKYTYLVEGTDAENATIVRTHTDGSGMQKVKAVKKNGKWYFTSVAIK